MQRVCAVLYYHLWPVRLYHIFLCFDFLYKLLSETFLILRIIERDMIINGQRSSCKVPVILVILRLRLKCDGTR